MKTYDQATPEVQARAVALMKRFYPEFVAVKLKVDFIFASTDSEDGHAVTHGGYPAAAVVRIVSLKDRAKGLGDIEIVIDRDGYLDMTDEEKDALLDHELYHPQLQLDKNRKVKFDGHGRPKLTMRKHDFQVGWFHEIARRHGSASGEYKQAQSLMGEHGQLYFGFVTTAKVAA